MFTNSSVGYGAAIAASGANGGGSGGGGGGSGGGGGGGSSSHSSGSSSGSHSGAPPAKLFVGGVPGDAATESEIRQLFERFGPVREVFFPPRRSNTGTACAIVTLGGGAAEAIAALDGSHRMRPSADPLAVRYKTERGAAPPPPPGAPWMPAPPQQTQRGAHDTKLFVGTLPRGADEAMLRPVFAAFGEITEIFFPPSNSRTGQQCAFVTYADASSCGAAIAALHGQHRFAPTDEPIVVRRKDVRGNADIHNKAAYGRGGGGMGVPGAGMGMPGAGMGMPGAGFVPDPAVFAMMQQAMMGAMMGGAMMGGGFGAFPLAPPLNAMGGGMMAPGMMGLPGGVPPAMYPAAMPAPGANPAAAAGIAAAASEDDDAKKRKRDATPDGDDDPPRKAAARAETESNA